VFFGILRWYYKDFRIRVFFYVFVKQSTTLQSSPYNIADSLHLNNNTSNFSCFVHGAHRNHNVQMCQISPTSLLFKTLPHLLSYNQWSLKELMNLLGVLKNLLPTPLNPKPYFLLMCMYIVDLI